MNWYLKVLKNYAAFGGRARRKEYWYFVLFNTIIMYFFVFLDIAMGTYQDVGFGVLQLTYSLAVILPGLGVTVRRLHDTDRSGWWLLISLVPIVGGIVLLIFLATDGTPEKNRFGPDPKEESVAGLASN